MEKEFIYVGKYTDTEGHTLLKIGTTNDLHRRQKEHERNYKKSPQYTMPKNGNFQYLWHLPLSKYNTIRFEDKNRQEWQDKQIGEFVRNDRFVIADSLETVSIKIRKTYEILIKNS